MVLSRIRRKAWQRWKQWTGRRLSEKQVARAKERVPIFSRPPKRVEKWWGYEDVSWSANTHHILKIVKGKYFPGTPAETNFNVTYAYTSDGFLESRSISDFLGERVVRYNPPGKQFGKVSRAGK